MFYILFLLSGNPVRIVLRDSFDNLFIFLPALDFDIIHCQCTECMDKGTCQTCIRNQRNIQINRCPANFIPIRQFPCGKVARDIHYQVNLLLMQHLKRLGFLPGFTRPIDQCAGNAIFLKETMSSSCRIQILTFLS